MMTEEREHARVDTRLFILSGSACKMMDSLGEVFELCLSHQLPCTDSQSLASKPGL